MSIPCIHQVAFGEIIAEVLLDIESRHFEMLANEINSSPPSAAYIPQWIGSALVHIMACRLFGAKPLLSVRPLGTNFSEIPIKIQDFSFTKMHLKMSSAKYPPFCHIYSFIQQHENTLTTIIVKIFGYHPLGEHIGACCSNRRGYPINFWCDTHPMQYGHSFVCFIFLWLYNDLSFFKVFMWFSSNSSGHMFQGLYSLRRHPLIGIGIWIINLRFLYP